MEKTEFVCESKKIGGELEVKVTVEGKTDMPFWNHDLKIKAAIALLETIDYKDYCNDGKENEFHQQLEELQEVIEGLHPSF
jgi:hypothetical protein